MLKALANGLRIMTITAVAAVVVANLLDKQEEIKDSNDGFQTEKYDDIW
ncbi:MAG: hypothetical protein PUB09_02145 [Firmicutes bacterium]|nr:hypothetical protein [Bacillota bacterium]